MSCEIMNAGATLGQLTDTREAHGKARMENRGWR